MKLLLDTHILLWFLTNDKKLSRTARVAIENISNERWLSPISLLQIALKSRLGKLPLPAPFGVLFPADLLAEDIHLLPLEPRHIEPLTTLPLHRVASSRRKTATTCRNPRRRYLTLLPDDRQRAVHHAIGEVHTRMPHTLNERPSQGNQAALFGGKDDAESSTHRHTDRRGASPGCKVVDHRLGAGVR
ncbi:MAG TPA: type II toxin-antitoxin system VapC family toxin [Pirellulales bacterium]|nr:type II toxin-antitoxin system VapC family toxin [Pirellulales bacterium]